MDNSDFILKWNDDLKVEIYSLPFQDDDIRKDFFGMLYDALDNYYKGYLLLELAEAIKNGKVAFDNSIPHKHISRIAEISQFPLLTLSHFHSLNRNLLYDSWCTFELCVTTLCSAVCTSEEFDKLLCYQYNDVLKLLKGNEISVNTSEKLRLSFKKSHLTHVSIARKTDLLFKKAQGYSRDVKQGKDLLLFLGKFRNTTHTNFIVTIQLAPAIKESA